MSQESCSIEPSVHLVTGLCQLALQLGLNAATTRSGAGMPVYETLASVAEVMNRVAHQVDVAGHQISDPAASQPAPVLTVEGLLQGV
jgi:hypothetical protein